MSGSLGFKHTQFSSSSDTLDPWQTQIDFSNSFLDSS